MHLTKNWSVSLRYQGYSSRLSSLPSSLCQLQVSYPYSSLSQIVFITAKVKRKLLLIAHLGLFAPCPLGAICYPWKRDVLFGLGFIILRLVRVGGLPYRTTVGAGSKANSRQTMWQRNRLFLGKGKSKWSPIAHALNNKYLGAQLCLTLLQPH